MSQYYIFQTIHFRHPHNHAFFPIGGSDASLLANVVVDSVNASSTKWASASLKPFEWQLFL